MPKLRSLLPTFTMLLFVAVAHTQEASVQASKGVGSGNGSTVSTVQVTDARSSGGVIGGIVSSYIGPGINGTKGRPFSADVIDETDQFMVDGNHIHRENHGKLFRDSEGRTRNETEIGIGHAAGGEPLVHITIYDPVQHKLILLDPRQKQAIVHPFGAASSPPGPRPVRPGTPGNLTAPPPPPAAGTPAESGALSESLRTSRQAQGRAALPAREDLGTSEIDGFTVTGTRFSHTIPTGERGNDKPMTTINERWFSRDLGIELLTKTESPETGVRTHKLVNIRSGDPDPLLFQVPADYTVKEQ
jgi:hypothetical protein